MENKKKHSFKEWVMATRPWSFPASAMPVLVTLAYLNWCGYAIDWIAGVWALLNIVIFHAAANTWSDYFDYKKGVDREDASLGAAFLVMAIVGGALMPPLQGMVIDAGVICGMPAVKFSYLLPMLCFVVVTMYGYGCRRMQKQN